jgi:hypothetical protein
MSPAKCERYNAYKDSGIEWIAEVPAHWKVARNKDIFEERGSLSISGDETLLTVSHITGVTRRTEKNVNMFMADTMEGYKLCKTGDLIIIAPVIKQLNFKRQSSIKPNAGKGFDDSATKCFRYFTTGSITRCGLGWAH